MPRGGRRVGRQGENYQQRTDLQQGARQPIRTVPGQTYGAGAAQRRAQQAVPLATPARPAAPVPGDPAAAPPAPPPPLTAPTQRPDEPLTAGLGAPMLPSLQQPTAPNIAQEDAEALRSRLPYIEFMASQPGATPSTRLLALRLRSLLGG